MMGFFSTSITWLLSEMVLSFLLWAAYLLFERLCHSSRDRYLFLKLIFLWIGALPFCSFVLKSAKKLLPQSAGFFIVKSVTFSSPSWVPGPWFGWVILALVVIYAFLVLVRIARVLASMVHLKWIAEEGEWVETLHDKWPVIVHSAEMPPATIGLFRPRILISRDVYDSVSENQLAMIFRHEIMHIQRADYFFNLVRNFIQCLLVASPFIADLGRRFEAEMELSCDDEMKRNENFAPREYGELLLHLSQTAKATPHLAYSGLFVSNSLITRRIIAMKEITKRNRPVLTASLFVVLALGVGTGVRALAIDASASGVAAAVSSKDVRFNLFAKVAFHNDTEGRETTKTVMALNYGETGSVVLDELECRLTPTQNGSQSDIVLHVFDRKLKKEIYEASAPLPESNKIDFQAEISPADNQFVRLHIAMTRF
jgi:hypothetical protein